MPRPHPLPRRGQLPADEPFPKFDPIPPTRHLSSVNVRRSEKAVFDALQSWLSYREGRALQQWEVMELVMRVALSSPAHPRFDGFEPWQA